MIIVTILPIILLLIYFYFQDKYEKEPLEKLVICFIVGMAITLQIEWIEDKLLYFNQSIIYQCFIVAGLTEELIKFIAIKITAYRDIEFDEQVDGIVYTTFLALGFAFVENLIFVNTYEIGLVRAFTAIPAHALFAVVMGYYLGKYMFGKYIFDLLKAIIIPIILHGIYDYLIISELSWGLFLFIPYMIGLWIKATKDIEISLSKSKFRRVQDDKVDKEK